MESPVNNNGNHKKVRHSITIVKKKQKLAVVELYILNDEVEGGYGQVCCGDIKETETRTVWVMWFREGIDWIFYMNIFINAHDRNAKFNQPFA